MRRLLPLLPFVLAGCGARTGLSEGLTETSCHSEAPICVQPAGDPCGAATTVDASCDAASHQWSCPSGSRIYARAADAGQCLPFHDTPGLSIDAWGLSSLGRVPTDDGRCLWISDSAMLSDGTLARNVAFLADPTAPFGTCPAVSAMPPTPIVTMEGGDDPNVLVQIDGGYRLAGVTHVLYRLFGIDASSPVGVDELGGGVGRWDPQTQKIVVGPPGKFPWGLDLDLGDAFVADDAGHELVLGCKQPGMFLVQGCELARLDENDGVELFSKDAQWIPSTDASLGAVLFGSGTWTSSITARASGLRHVYAVDFGGTIQTHVASSATGPWTDGPDLAPCDLPSADSKAFCAGPIVHDELGDPTRPDELVVSYGVGSSGTGTGKVDDYWPRLVWTK